MILTSNGHSMDLKEIFEKDKRGVHTGASFVEQISDTTAIHSYYGQGFGHEGIFSYDENGWKFEKYYDREFEKLSEEGKAKLMNDIVNGLKKHGLTEIKDDGNHITFSRKK